jgi:hypothetical protein
MKIKLNQVFSTAQTTEFEHWGQLTAGESGLPLDRFKGMPYFKAERGMVPLINFHSNPFKEETDDAPWRDLILQDEGRIIYNGDNKNSKQLPHEARGNKKVLQVFALYASHDKRDRILAPPIIVTKTVKRGAQTGFRQFIGVGILRKPPELVQQYERKNNRVFSNFRFEVSLIKLAPEDVFDWGWIDDRRNPDIPVGDSLKKAPSSWKKWVNKGDDAFPNAQLKIKSYRVVSKKEQNDMPARNQTVINDLLGKHYPDATKDGIRFEAMASFVSDLFFENQNYLRGWITPGSSDRGVDFVGRLDIGLDSFSNTSIIVLGQSKRYKNSISGESLTRVASRMTRGYIGVVVTLDTFTEPAQAEILDDKLPIILIGGKQVSQLLLNYMNKSGKGLKQIVQEQDAWARNNVGDEHYDTILYY